MSNIGIVAEIAMPKRIILDCKFRNLDGDVCNNWKQEPKENEDRDPQVDNKIMDKGLGASIIVGTRAGCIRTKGTMRCRVRTERRNAF